jgi:hypothetical protein
MSPCAELIDTLYGRLTLRYGHAFLARWSGLALQAVKEDWARELASYAERPAAIGHALALLDPAEPPTAARFRELCASAPAPAFRAGPESKQRQRAAEVRRKCLRPVAPRTERDVAWATEILQRTDASSYSRRLALEALGRHSGLQA